jgi:hypothetical protein
MKRFLRFGYIAGIAGGILLAVGNLLALTVPGDKFSQQVMTSAFLVSSATRLVGAVAMVLGIAALAAGQAEKTGRFGFIAYALVIGNMLLQSGWMFSDTFIVRTLATYAPNVVDGKNSPQLLGIGFMLAWLLNATFILFAIAMWRAKVYSKWAVIGILLAGLITLVPLPVDGPIYEIIIGLVFAGALFAASQTKPAEVRNADVPATLAPQHSTSV